MTRAAGVARLALAALFVALLLSAPKTARADAVADAKAYFRAGATAYAAGDYQAAIQALEAAYRATPLPAIAFSLAQAERRQYFVSREPGHLRRSIALFRGYLGAVATGGRRNDALEALSQLEPLAMGLMETETESDPLAIQRAPRGRTRVMVTSPAPGASISIDDAATVPAPLIAEVEPGRHVVSIEAPGFFPSERAIVALEGELVPLEVELKERPAEVLIQVSADADLYVDGDYSRQVERTVRLELASGRHRFSFARKGYRLVNIDVTLERGETRTVRAELELTRQRIAALTLLAVSGTSLAAGLGFGAAALTEEEQARRLLDARNREPLEPSEREAYEDAVEARARYRAASVAALSLSAVSFVTGLFLHEMDQPNLREASFTGRLERRKAVSARLHADLSPSPDGLSLGARVAW